jgi:hypothetical protein
VWKETGSSTDSASWWEPQASETKTNSTAIKRARRMRQIFHTYGTTGLALNEVEGALAESELLALGGAAATVRSRA